MLLFLELSNINQIIFTFVEGHFYTLNIFLVNEHEEGLFRKKYFIVKKSNNLDLMKIKFIIRQ